MCNWFQNKSPTHTFAVDYETWHCKWAAPCYFNGASPTGSLRWGYCLQWHLACEGLYYQRPNSVRRKTHPNARVSLMVTSSNGNIFRVTGPFGGNPPMTGWFPHKASDAELWCFINGWANNRDAADLRRHRGHYDVTVMCRHWPLMQIVAYGRDIVLILCSKVS